MGKYIISDPEILGGRPVIKGTRVPIDRILFLLKDGYTLEAIHEDYSHIDIKTLSAAIDEAIEALNTTLHCQESFINLSCHWMRTCPLVNAFRASIVGLMSSIFVTTSIKAASKSPLSICLQEN